MVINGWRSSAIRPTHSGRLPLLNSRPHKECHGECKRSTKESRLHALVATLFIPPRVYVSRGGCVLVFLIFSALHDLWSDKSGDTEVTLQLLLTLWWLLHTPESREEASGAIVRYRFRSVR